MTNTKNMYSLRNNVMKSCVFVLRTMDDRILFDKHNNFNADEISNITGFCHTGFTTEKDLENAYMDNGGNECPHCGGTDISSCGFESDDTYAWREVECENCGKEWKELFSMTGIEL